MLRLYFKAGIRNLSKNKGFTFLNVFGLSLGLGICLLIVFYVIDELSYDKYNKNADRIVRVNSDMKFGGATTYFAIAAPSVAAALKSNFPEVENTVRICPVVGIRFRKGDEEIKENRSAYSDPSLFDIFTLSMIQGNPKTALVEPNSMVVSESTAKKYFNKTDIIGQTIMSVNDSITRKITGVYSDIPKQSHFNFDLILSMSSLPGSDDINWVNLNFNTYVLLKKGVDYKKLELKLPSFFDNALENIKFSVKDFEEGGNYYRINFSKLTDIHLQSNRERELGVNGSIQYVYIFSAIALFVLVMACINFINLSTARSSSRAREVGVRKVLGSPRTYLIAQFLCESIIITIIAIVIAIMVAWGLLPSFNRALDTDLAITLHTFTWLLPSVVMGIIIVGILAGSYPAFFLSGFRPTDVLKGKLSRGFKGGGLRNFLVVFQFTLSIFLIIATLVIYNQLHYIQNKNLGFDRDHVLLVKNLNTLDNAKTLKQDVKVLNGVTNATQSSFFPTGNLRWPRTVSINNKTRISIFTEFWPVDEDYLGTMGMLLVKGRNFSSQFLTDSSGMIINETAARMLGISGNSLDQTVYNDDENNKKYHILGIIKDFNFNSLRENITPVVLTHGDGGASSLGVRVKSGNLTSLVSQIKNKWKRLSPHQQFEYSFMDEDFNAIYRNEQRMGRLFAAFATLAIVIGCLGLFGLAAYAAEQRSREISIRKILGANVPTLVIMLSKDFLKLVIISILIAAPVAWFAMRKWLEGFSYRENIHWWTILLAAAGAIFIALFAVSSQAIKAAFVNPVKTLKSD